MSSPNDRNEPEFEDQLRQILRAEADEVTPSAEGLNLIRERTERQRGSSWFGLPWLRPVTAVAAAVLIVASVIMSSPQVREQVLEIVPAGADREGTPPETQSDGGDGVAAPDPSTDSTSGTSKLEEETGDDPEGTPSPDSSPSSSEDDGFEATSPCPPGEELVPTATDGARDEDKRNKDDDRDDRGSDKETCAPTDEPKEEPTDEPTSPGGGSDPDPGDGAEDPGSGSGGGGEEDGASAS
ncbi:hypothetical protein [Nocardiopsis sp. L17-MgMaSL7]|uniref:hypothetical protein n=1 Tax=Nocardiopsis sp. L17-MgMaSL7 TaxID=1938893 RepID=UPI000D719B1E|nr:hypothetical protein [Nocardiopsis sp. L17-MgMaSL7]PWV57938.1 hypothetical protein BDW27_101173 [Nocardiopsis sp. L17-MgMaSL7]